MNRHQSAIGYFFKETSFQKLFIAFILLLTLPATAIAQRQMESLDRGLVAVNRGSDVFLSWRFFASDADSLGFNIYRNGTKVNNQPITSTTNFVDPNGGNGDSYHITPVSNGNEGNPSETVDVWSDQFISLDLNRPSGGTVNGNSYDFTPNDASVGDLDGDKEYEIVLKWKPANAKDNSQDGYTGPTILDAYQMDGTHMWRINLGINVRAGAHYTQFLVYDFDGDGKSEVTCRTADGSTDGQGNVIGDPNADYRNGTGRILTGPEYLTVFDGETGEAVATEDFRPARGDICQWGDCYGNRGDRFLATVAYLDGQTPSFVMCRGYYEKTMLSAWDFNNGQLNHRWTFDSDNNPDYAGQGNHNLSVGDVDNDSRDEIMYGAMAVDDDGTGLHSTGMLHGDAGHMSDLDPDRPGQEYFMPHESAGGTNSIDGTTIPGVSFRDAETGEILWTKPANDDVGRGVSANIDPNHYGAESWAAQGLGLYNAQGNQIGNIPEGINFVIWWDGDYTRELLNEEKLDKWDPDANGGQGGNQRIYTIYDDNADAINGSKSVPNLQADILGDWREELIYRHWNNEELLIFTTTYETDHRLFTLMHDPQYRMAVAWQNVGYNQPPHPSFYLGEDGDQPDPPDVVPVKYTYFNATQKGQHAQLTWQTTTEKNTDYFEVQRSPDGEDFTVIKQIKASSTKQSSHKYSYFDTSIEPTGVVYYRIVGRDYDGTPSPTSSRSVYFGESSALSVDLYPNPVQDDFTVSVNGPVKKQYHLKITTPSGKEIRKKFTNDNKIQIKALPPGIYILQLTSGNASVTRRLISY